MHAREDVVDVFQVFRGNRRLDLALTGEVQSFLQIESRSDDRAPNGDGAIAMLKIDIEKSLGGVPLSDTVPLRSTRLRTCADPRR